MSSPSADNIDHTNQIDACLLVRQIWRLLHTNTPQELSLFLEKLAEITTGGPCAQGRVARMFPFYESALAEIMATQYNLTLDTVLSQPSPSLDAGLTHESVPTAQI